MTTGVTIDPFRCAVAYPSTPHTYQHVESLLVRDSQMQSGSAPMWQLGVDLPLQRRPRSARASVGKEVPATSAPASTTNQSRGRTSRAPSRAPPGADVD